MNDEFSVVGKSLPVVDAFEKVTGKLRFAGDLKVPGMLHAKILRSPYAHARIINIDTSKAEALSGVKAVITHKDIPQKEWWCSSYNWKGPVMEEIVRFRGDEVAAIAAIDEETAAKALGLIEVEYEEMPAVFDIEEAMRPNAPQVRPDGNVRPPTIIEWGDGKGFKEADFIIEHVNRIGYQQHATIDRNAAIASWDGDRVTLWTSTQTAFHLRKQIANLFDLPISKVRVISTPTGGSFGFWWTNNFHFIAISLAKKAGMPVKLELTRQEVMSTIKRRETAVSTVKLGVRNDGKIIAASYKHLFDNGAYGNKIDPYQTIADLYAVPNGRYEVVGISTNLVTGGCMRGVGDLTLGLAIDQAIEKAAEKLDMDPVEMKKKNICKSGDILQTSQESVLQREIFPDREGMIVRLTSCGVEECLTRCSEFIGWKKKWKGWGKPSEVKGLKRRGIGIALSAHASGVSMLGPNAAIVKVNTDGSVNFLTGVGRMGQGADTTQAQIVAEVLGISLEDIVVTAGDTDTCPETCATVASISAHMVSPATKAAAEDARRQILELASVELGVEPEDLDIKERRVYVKRNPQSGITIKELLNTFLAKTLALPVVVGIGAEGFPFDKGGKMFMAHGVEVEVDTETCKVKVLKYVAVHDSGKIINPAICENQVQGGAIMNCGFALTEDLLIDKDTGTVLAPDFMDYKILSALDVPDAEVSFVETKDPNGVFGAKGIGEGVSTAGAAAIVSAVYNAIGVRIDPPITPEKILRSRSPYI